MQSCSWTPSSPASGASHPGWYAPAFVERPGFEDDGDDVHDRLIQKLLRLKKRRAEEQLREAWSRDGESGLLIPPGWVKTSDGGPMEPEDRDY